MYNIQHKWKIFIISTRKNCLIYNTHKIQITYTDIYRSPLSATFLKFPQIKVQSIENIHNLRSIKNIHKFKLLCTIENIHNAQSGKSYKYPQIIEQYSTYILNTITQHFKLVNL